MGVQLPLDLAPRITAAAMREQAKRLLIEEIPAIAEHGHGPGRGHTEKRDGATNSFPVLSRWRGPVPTGTPIHPSPEGDGPLGRF